MSCNGCTRTYGFFTKETGCPNCKYSFCTKCLKKTIAVPRLNNKPHKVCLNCFGRLTSESTAKPLPPETTIDNGNHDIQPNTPPADVLLIASDPPGISTPVLQPNDPDDLIKQRLLLLKEDRSNNSAMPVTDNNIAIRIANLKDQPFNEASSSRDHAILLNTDRRTDVEKSYDLLEQFRAEVQLDDEADPVKDIERRLAALRGDCSSSKAASPADSSATVADEISDDDQVEQLVARYMAEAALANDEDDKELELTDEEKAFVADVAPKAMAEGRQRQEANKANDDAELPWCVICNEDAELRYQGDLFCRSCYREVRDDE